jgi:hypothetical protein
VPQRIPNKKVAAMDCEWMRWYLHGQKVKINQIFFLCSSIHAALQVVVLFVEIVNVLPQIVSHFYCLPNSTSYKFLKYEPRKQASIKKSKQISTHTDLQEMR